MRTRRMLTLGRWLGPWADEARAPGGVARRELRIPPEAPGDAPLRAWLYRPVGRAPGGALLLVPGLHFLGPADPRLDRFASVLAASGAAVLAPFLPDFLALRLAPRLAADAARAFRALLAAPERPSGLRPGVVSISFGSILALRLASDAATRDEVGAALLFGGYADWRDAMRFCLGGEAAGGHRGPHDPLNRPVVMMNLLPALPGAPRDGEPLRAAWRRFVEATWGRPEMKAPARWRPVAEALRRGLAPADRALFDVGCGLAPGALALAEEALAAAGEGFAWLDPAPLLGAVAPPVTVAHGADDDVIPWTHARALAEGLPARVRRGPLVTGLYAHTGKAAGGGRASLAARVRAAPALAGELATMGRLLAALADTAGAPAR